MEQGKRSVRFDNELQVEAYCFQGIMQRFPNHFHEYYVIGFIESGRRHLICKNKDYQVKSGALLLFNPSDSHTCEAIDDAPLDYRCINIKRRTMWRVAEEITGKGCLPYFSETVVPDSGLTELLRQLHHMIMEGRKEFDKEELFYFLTEQLIRKYAEPGEGGSSPFIHQEAEKVRLYLETHYEEKISLDKLAAMTDMNKYSLLRTFTRLYGITPYRYLENIRVNKAKEFLEHGGEPLDAAMAAGFSDQSHFTNYFKEFIGLTPGQYRDIFRE